MSIPSGRSILQASLSAALLLGCGGVLSGCPKSETTSTSPAKAAGLARAPDVSYTTRGIVESLPIPDKPTSEFIVRHEAIDNFFNPVNGNLGMNAMSMPFTLGKGVSLGTIKVGDKVSLTFGVW
ncbi:MAG: copper-binding protein, partial [Phycisphaerales bacterium]|nr:copper-binding protein [Phycisphaerales bacterium]